MRKIVSSALMVLTILLLNFTVSTVSSINLFNRNISVFQAVISNKQVLTEIANADMSSINYNLIPFFYCGICLIPISFIIDFEKDKIVSSCILLLIGLTTSTYAFFANNYIYLFLVLNLLFFIYILIKGRYYEKVQNVIIFFFSLCSTSLNVVFLVKHLLIVEIDLDEISRMSLLNKGMFYINLVPFVIIILLELKKTFVNMKQMSK